MDHPQYDKIAEYAPPSVRLAPFSPAAAKPGLLRRAWLPLLLALLGLLPFYGRKTFVGDMADSRFNMYVLEHGYQTLRHHPAAFWDAPFFYPHPNVLAYSDHHLGSLPLYSLFRAAKCGREQAFQNWALATLALTYFSGYLALRGFGAGRLAAALAAYVFAFGLPVQGQVIHSQLLPRYVLPWVFVFATRWAERGRTRDFAWAAALTVWQMYIGIYCGLFTFVILAAYLLALGLTGDRAAFLRHTVGGGARAAVSRFGVALLACAAMLPAALPYLRAAREVGTRHWVDITPLLPRLNSWLLPPPESLAWSWLREIPFLRFRELPYAHEHQNFAGGVALLALLAWPLLRPARKRLGALAGGAWWAVLISVVLTLFAWDCTLWRLLFYVPGFGAMRAVSRIALYLLFPLSIVIAAALDGLIRRAGAGMARPQAAAAGCLLALAVLVDSGVTHVLKTPFRDSTSAVGLIKTRLKALDGGLPEAFWVCQLDAPANCITELNAMLAAQDLGIKTINGYSGWQPPCYRLELSKTQAPPAFHRLKEWLAGEAASSRNVAVLDHTGAVAWRGPSPRQYELGSTVDFADGDSEWCLDHGFAGGPGRQGVRIAGPEGVLLFRVREMPGRDLTLTLDAGAPAARASVCRIRVNGVEIGRRAVPGPFEWSLAIPAEIANAGGGTLEIGIGASPLGAKERFYLKSLRVD